MSNQIDNDGRPDGLDGAFLPWQVQRLRQPVPKSLLHTRQQGGKTLEYIASHDAIDMANDVLGVGNWSYTTAQVWCVGAVYHALVTLQVHTPSGQIVERGDLGTCDIQGWKPGQEPNINAVQQAAKGCVSDGVKRCLRSLGSYFGNHLYRDDESEQPQPTRASPASRPAQPHAAPAAKAAPIGPERAAKLEGLVQKALTDQGATVAYALNWLDAAQRRLGKAHMSDLTAAEGQALLDRAARADVTQPPDAPAQASPAPADGSWESTASPARQPDPEQGQTQACPACGQPMLYKTGVKDGKEWKAWMCSARCGAAPQWVNDRQGR